MATGRETWWDGRWDVDYVLERFNDEYLPVLKKHGGLIGERAMQGDSAAEAIIRRYNLFTVAQDPNNLHLLGIQLKSWLKEHEL